jgi:hypothetical protein
VITRVWYGWTSKQNADSYEALLKTEIIPGIAARRIAGCRGIELGRRDLGAEVEFITIMQFESLDAVRQFAGADFETAVVPAKAQALLSRFDQKSAHYEVRSQLRF